MYTNLIIQLIASFIQHNVIQRDYYNKHIHPLVQLIFKTNDVEQTCKLTWNNIVNNDLNTKLSMELAITSSNLITNQLE